MRNEQLIAEAKNAPHIRATHAQRLDLIRRLAAALEALRYEDVGPAASCHLCVGAGGHEDYDGEWVECSCQRDTRVHNHDLDPSCRESEINGRLRGECMAGEVR